MGYCNGNRASSRIYIWLYLLDSFGSNASRFFLCGFGIYLLHLFESVVQFFIVSVGLVRAFVVSLFRGHRGDAGAWGKADFLVVISFLQVRARLNKSTLRNNLLFHSQVNISPPLANGHDYQQYCY
jgi:hypothetical protein